MSKKSKRSRRDGGTDRRYFAQEGKISREEAMRRAEIVISSDHLALEPELSALRIDPDRLAEVFLRRLEAAGYTLDELDDMTVDDRSEIVLDRAEEVIRTEIHEADLQQVARALEDARFRLLAEGEPEAAEEVEVLLGFLSDPRMSESWDKAGVLKRIVAKSVQEGLGIVDDDLEDDVAVMMKILNDLFLSLLSADLLLGLYDEADLQDAHKLASTALAEAGLPALGSKQEEDMDPDTEEQWARVVLDALQGYVDEIRSPGWNSGASRYLRGLADREEILDDDWEIGVRFLSAALVDKEVPAEEIRGMLSAALLGELTVWSEELQLPG